MDQFHYCIDIGTNSVRLMLARMDGKRPSSVYKRLNTVRTGEGVNASQRLKDEAIVRTVDAIAAFCEQARNEHPGAPIDCFATSAVRDSANAAALTSAVFARTGVRVRILSGEQEAACGFAGAVGQGCGGIVDIGGGSTEIVFGAQGSMRYRHSFDVGCVRALELDRLPGKIRAWACEEFMVVPFAEAENLHFYAIGGTATALAAVELGMTEYDPARVQGYVLTASHTQALLDRLAGLTLNERRALPGLSPKRAEVVVFGAAILCGFFDASGFSQVLVSDSDNLEGYLLLTNAGLL